MKTLSTQLHDLGFRVTLWVHPFCNIDAECFVDGANKGYWVKQLNSDLPGLTSWWWVLIFDSNANSNKIFF
jgi:alpha-glucosidase (family GH31 glycosyl hydrolase)